MNTLRKDLEKIILEHFNGQRQKEIVKDMDQKINPLVLNNLQALDQLETLFKERTNAIIGEDEAAQEAVADTHYKKGYKWKSDGTKYTRNKLRRQQRELLK